MEFKELKPYQSFGGMDIKAFKSLKKAKKYCYLMAGVHGDEVEGVYVLDKLFNWLKTEVDLLKVSFVIIPILNIDGYKVGTRVNARGVDLNRNLPTNDWNAEYTEDKYNPGPAPLSENENIFLDKLLNKYPPGIIISFHSWKPILNINADCEEVAKFLKQHNNYPIQEDIGYPTPGSFGTYAPQKYGSPVLTFECPKISKDLSLEQIWKENEVGLKKLLADSDQLLKHLI